MSHVLITGANRGIGLELCRQYAERGDNVIAVCRKSSRELDVLGVRVETGVDVSSPENVADLRNRLEGVAIDLLISNAGLLVRNSLGDLDFDTIRRQFEVNAMGPLIVADAFLGAMGPGSKLVIITSRMGSLGDNTSGGAYGYRMSKAAVNMAGLSLSRDLKGRSIAVGIIHPGHVRTDMGGPSGQVEVDESARGVIARIDGLNLENSGSFWHFRGEILPW